MSSPLSGVSVGPVRVPLTDDISWEFVRDKVALRRRRPQADGLRLFESTENWLRRPRSGFPASAVPKEEKYALHTHWSPPVFWPGRLIDCYPRWPSGVRALLLVSSFAQGGETKSSFATGTFDGRRGFNYWSRRTGVVWAVAHTKRHSFALLCGPANRRTRVHRRPPI